MVFAGLNLFDDEVFQTPGEVCFYIKSNYSKNHFFTINFKRLVGLVFFPKNMIFRSFLDASKKLTTR